MKTCVFQQGIVFQLNDAIISPATKSSFGTVIPILVSGIAAIQLKFGWAKKSDKAKKCLLMKNYLNKNFSSFYYYSKQN